MCMRLWNNLIYGSKIMLSKTVRGIIFINNLATEVWMMYLRSKVASTGRILICMEGWGQILDM